MLKIALVVLSAISLSSSCWKSVPGRLKQIDGGLINAVWGVNVHDFIYRLRSNGRTWTRIPGRLKHVSAGQGGVWGVNKHDYIYYRHGTILGGNGGSWQRIGGRLKQIDSGADGIVFGVNRQDYIYCRLGINTAAGNYIGNGWRRVGGRLKYVSCGRHACWGVDRSNAIYVLKLQGVTPSNCAGTSTWKFVPGRLKQIEISLDSEVWGVNKYNQIYYREGMTTSYPRGTRWVKVDGRLKHVTNGYRGVRGVNRFDVIYHRK